MSKNLICVTSLDKNQSTKANLFAKTNNLPVFTAINKQYKLNLCYINNYIELHDTALNTSINVDFLQGVLAHRKEFGGGRGQAIAKAIGLKGGSKPTVLDITAGLARDAFVLITLECNISLVEKSPVLVELIRDGIERAKLNTEINNLFKNTFTLTQMDSIKYMKNITDSNKPDVIYMDPMYPERKKSALVKKDMQILHTLLGTDNNADELLYTALKHAKNRVVVKRPVQAENINNTKPGTSIHSKKTRYDIYFP